MEDAGKLRVVYFIDGDSIYDSTDYKILKDKVTVSIKNPTGSFKSFSRIHAVIGVTAFYSRNLAREAYISHIQDMVKELDKEVEEFRSRIKTCKSKLLEIKAATLREYGG